MSGARTEELGLSARRTFNSGDLVGGVLTYTHNLNAEDGLVDVVIMDDTGKQVAPDDVTFTSSTVVDVDLSTLGVPGAPDWTISAARRRRA